MTFRKEPSRNLGSLDATQGQTRDVLVRLIGWCTFVHISAGVLLEFILKNNFGNTDISFTYLIMGKIPDSGKQGHRLGRQTVRVPHVVMP